MKRHRVQAAAALVLSGALIFVLGSCSKKADRAGSSPSQGEGFYVMSCDPQGELPAAVKFPAVYVQFSKPVVPLAALGEGGDSSPYMKITPPLKGVFRWYGTSLLAFESSEEVFPQHEYTVEVPQNVTPAEGEKLTGERV
ncbi:MAG: hypothetical protein LBR23_08960, partial [Spirochaetaceae bacterium]|nr:hypothetical protein [Spirochaetaceae bacterium]